MKKHFLLILIIVIVLIIACLTFFWISDSKEVPFVKDDFQNSRTSIKFTGKVVVLGTYYVDTEDYIFGDSLLFDVNDISKEKIPRSAVDARQLWFYFSNQDEAKKKFNVDTSLLKDGICSMSGKAEIVIRDYREYIGESEGSDGTKLEKVISFDKPTLKKCDPPQYIDPARLHELMYR